MSTVRSEHCVLGPRHRHWPVTAHVYLKYYTTAAMLAATFSVIFLLCGTAYAPGASAAVATLSNGQQHSLSSDSGAAGAAAFRPVVGAEYPELKSIRERRDSGMSFSAVHHAGPVVTARAHIITVYCPRQSATSTNQTVQTLSHS